MSNFNKECDHIIFRLSITFNKVPLSISGIILDIDTTKKYKNTAAKLLRQFIRISQEKGIISDTEFESVRESAFK